MVRRKKQSVKRIETTLRELTDDQIAAIVEFTDPNEIKQILNKPNIADQTALAYRRNILNTRVITRVPQYIENPERFERTAEIVNELEALRRENEELREALRREREENERLRRELEETRETEPETSDWGYPADETNIERAEPETSDWGYPADETEREILESLEPEEPEADDWGYPEVETKDTLESDEKLRAYIDDLRKEGTAAANERADILERVLKELEEIRREKRREIKESGLEFDPDKVKYEIDDDDPNVYRDIEEGFGFEGQPSYVLHKSKYDRYDRLDMNTEALKRDIDTSDPIKAAAVKVWFKDDSGHEFSTYRQIDPSRLNFEIDEAVDEAEGRYGFRGSGISVYAFR